MKSVANEQDARGPVATLRITIAEFVRGGGSQPLRQMVYEGEAAYELLSSYTRSHVARDGHSLPYKVDRSHWQTWNSGTHANRFFGVNASNCVTLMPAGGKSVGAWLRVEPKDCGCKH